MLTVKDLIVFYENAIAVNDLSMEVREGQIVGVIGSNSAGKTTLMNTLSGLIWDMRLKEQRRGGERITVMGSVSFFGEDISNLPAYRRAQAGIVLCRERHPIFPDSTVVENLRIAGYLRSWADIKKGLELSFELFPNLARHRKRKAGFLSGGEQQMLAIGMAMMVGAQAALAGRAAVGAQSGHAEPGGGGHPGRAASTPGSPWSSPSSSPGPCCPGWTSPMSSRTACSPSPGPGPS